MLVGGCWCMCGVDPYEGFRDKRGRFMKGNPGRTTYSWLSHEEFSERYPFLLVVSPGACPDCGGSVYRFNVRFDGKNSYVVCARCNVCNRRRWYGPYMESWGSM